jgi:hypothetical protein
MFSVGSGGENLRSDGFFSPTLMQGFRANPFW